VARDRQMKWIKFVLFWTTRLLSPSIYGLSIAISEEIISSNFLAEGG